MHGDPPRNPRRSTEKPTEMHRGPENFDSNKKSNIKVADASTPTTVFSKWNTPKTRGAYCTFIRNALWMRVSFISFLNVGYVHFIDFDKDLNKDFMTLYRSFKLAPFILEIIWSF